MDRSLGQEWAGDLHAFRVALGYTPKDRFSQLDDHLTALTEVVQSAQRIYDNLNVQMRNSGDVTNVTSVNDVAAIQSTPFCHVDDNMAADHIEAVSVLQNETPRRPRSCGINIRNILPKRLRDHKGVMNTK